MNPICAAATAATSKARKSGDPEDHDAAADAHGKAAKAAFKDGDPKTAKVHTDLAKEHRAKGSDSSSSGNAPKGLAAWAGKK